MKSQSQKRKTKAKAAIRLLFFSGRCGLDDESPSTKSQAHQLNYIFCKRSEAKVREGRACLDGLLHLAAVLGMLERESKPWLGLSPSADDTLCSTSRPKLRSSLLGAESSSPEPSDWPSWTKKKKQHWGPKNSLDGIVSDITELRRLSSMNYLRKPQACQWSSVFYTSAEAKSEKMHRPVKRERERVWVASYRKRACPVEVTSRDGKGKRGKKKKKGGEDPSAIQVPISILSF